jgi:DNA-binding response OmpR family regulator
MTAAYTAGGRIIPVAFAVPLNPNEELYRSVRLVLGDGDREFIKTLAPALFPIGLRDVAVCADGAELKKAIVMSVDVVVCDIDLPGIDFKAFVQDVRHERIGGNPFIVLIGTTKPTDEATVARVLESGVDDVIVKPIDAPTLVRRIAAFVKGRKPFVISSGYIGPSRRAARREDGSDDDALLDVPNSLRAKVAFRQSAQDIALQIQAGRAGLGNRAAQSNVRVLARLTRKLVELQRDSALVDQSRRVLRLLANKATEVAISHRNASLARFIVPIAERISLLAFRAETAVRPSTVEIDLLAKLSDAAQIAAAAPAMSASEPVPEIIAIVDAYLGKR